MILLFIMMIENISNNPISTDTISIVADQLGREPRGLEAIEVSDKSGLPSVIRVSSLVDKKPFPTMFWLVNKELCYNIDKLEAAGVISEIQHKIDESKKLQSQLFNDHTFYITLREQNMIPGVKKYLIKHHYYDQLQKRGIGGISNFSRVRCLHTYYASHLVKSNIIGRIIDESYF